MSIEKKTQKKASEVKVKTKLEEAQEIIDKEKNERVKKFSEGVDALKKQYNCDIIPEGQFSGNNIQTLLVAIAK